MEKTEKKEKNFLWLKVIGYTLAGGILIGVGCMLGANNPDKVKNAEADTVSGLKKFGNGVKNLFGKKQPEIPSQQVSEPPVNVVKQPNYANNGGGNMGRGVNTRPIKGFNKL